MYYRRSHAAEHQANAEKQGGVVRYLEYKGFNRSLHELYQKGGKYKTAANKVSTILENIGMVEDPLEGMRLTNHGESRIKHCIKYRLNDSCRLITIRHQGCCFLLFAASHDDADEWLDRNRGLSPVFRGNGGFAGTYVSEGMDEGERITGPAGHTNGKLCKLLPRDLFDLLVAEGVTGTQVMELGSLESADSEEELNTLLSTIDDGARRQVLYDVFSLLRREKVDEAIERAGLYLGHSMGLEDMGPEDLPDLIDSEFIKQVPPDSRAYAEAIRRFATQANYHDWMLFMHPEQDAVVNEDFNGPAKLAGVSGSGKTCVVVKRAVRLAGLYQDSRILILTINRPLALLISQLVDACADKQVRQRIDVMPMFRLCQQILLELETENKKIYDETTWKINEHVDEIWQEYYRCDVNNFDARAFHPVHDSLIARGWNAERYLLEEVDWVRSRFGIGEREDYLTENRPHRKVGMPRHFREAVQKGLDGWEDKMRDVGVADGLGVASALWRHLSQIEPRYRSILVDEGQDFGNIELEIVRALAPHDTNDLFVCGDAAQAVTTKYQNLKGAGIDVAGTRSKKLALNYRNNRDILSVAHKILAENFTEDMIDREDFDVFDPEFSARGGSTPLLLEASDLEHEIGYAIDYAKERLAELSGGKACIAVCGYSAYELLRFGNAVALPVLTGSVDIDDGSLFLSDLEQTKGFEFNIVLVLNCSAEIFPGSDLPDDEWFRDLARLYVAMTRATDDLVISYSSKRSPFLEAGVKDLMIDTAWSEYAESGPRLVGIPEHLEEYRSEAERHGQLLDMTGEEFLYTRQARGLSIELIAKIRELVDGKGRVRRKARDRWENIGQAADDYRDHVKWRRVWGPDVGKQFGELIERLRGS